MAMGRRKADRQERLFVAAAELPKSQGHPFYKALNRLLAAAGFDRWIEQRCQPYYAQVEKRGQPSLPPVRLFSDVAGRRFRGDR
jgi:transposase